MEEEEGKGRPRGEGTAVTHKKTPQPTNNLNPKVYQEVLNGIQRMCKGLDGKPLVLSRYNYFHHVSISVVSSKGS